METKQKNTCTGNDPLKNRNLFVGVTLVAAGILWLLKNFRVLSYETFDIIFSWPSLLIVLGGYLLSQCKWLWGAIIALVGVCLLASDLAGIQVPFNKLILPLLCVGAGVAVLLNKNK